MLFDLFKRNSFDKLKAHYLSQTTEENLVKYPWMAMAINQRTINQSLLTKELVFTSVAPKTIPPHSIQLAELESGIVHHVYLGPQKIYSGEMNDATEIKKTREYFNSLLDAFIEKEIKHFSETMNTGEFSPRQLEAEDKALEWLRVSFEVLTKAVLESLTNPEYLFQTTFFAGINPKTKMHEMRLMTFNLDITFLLLEDKNLRVLIYNKKPQDKMEDLKPALIGDYSFRKREMFDHFIKLLAGLSKGLHA